MIHQTKTMTIEEAIIFATTAHRDQTDKIGQPYIRHCLRVMERVAPDHDAMIVGVLHDVLEDTTATITDESVGPTAWRALWLLKHEKDVSYEDYITILCEKAPCGALARKVKLADLADNLSRNDELPEPKRSLLRSRYESAAKAIECVDNPTRIFVDPRLAEIITGTTSR